MGTKKKVEEALAHIQEAEKSLKTGLLKWKPDYDVAADEYNKAATCYKTIKEYAKCRECLLKSAENHRICKSAFAAAKCYDQATLMSKELGDFDQAAALCEKAATLYRAHGIGDTAALSLDKGAKILESHNVEKAIHLYKYAVEIVMTEDRPRQAVEYQSKISRHLVRLKRYDEAIDSVKKELAMYQQAENTGAMGRDVVALVLLQFARGDEIAAEKVYREWGGCTEHEEAQTIERLLHAFDTSDGEMATKALDSPFIKHMDVEYARLAKTIPVPKTTEPKKRGGDNMGEREEGEDDEELDLC